jgi:hypothetical protein
MRFENRHSLLVLWIGLAFLVPGLGLVHALPHAHAEDAHPVSEQLPASHQPHGHDHGHPHGHDHGHPPEAPPESHHHHTLDGHFEPDPLRLQKRTQNAVSIDTAADVLSVDAPIDDLDSTTIAVAPVSPTAPRPAGPAAARGPPAQD